MPCFGAIGTGTRLGVPVACRSYGTFFGMDVVLVLERSTPAVGSDGILVMDIGIETFGGAFTPILKTGEATPCTRSETFSTSTDEQSAVLVRLYRTKGTKLEGAHFLGEVRIAGFEPAPRGMPQIKVSFRVEKARIEMFARDTKADIALDIALVHAA
jgi:molecular chaperone DnaK (HSP70)